MTTLPTQEEEIRQLVIERDKIEERLSVALDNAHADLRACAEALRDLTGHGLDYKRQPITTHGDWSHQENLADSCKQCVALARPGIREVLK